MAANDHAAGQCWMPLGRRSSSALLAPGGCAARTIGLSSSPTTDLPPRRVSPGGEATEAQKGTLMNSTMVEGTDTAGRRLWADLGWPACNERLVTVVEAIARRVGDATTQLPECGDRGQS